MSHLSVKQMSSLEQLLDQRELDAQTQIHAEAGRREDEPFAELTGEVSDVGDESSADVIVDIDNARMGLQLVTLNDIALARQRISDKCYGICIDCGTEIEYSRLQAYPTAKRCTACQQVHEHTHANFTHARL